LRKETAGVAANENIVSAGKLIEKVYGREGREDR
jgi:hypothetical protein